MSEKGTPGNFQELISAGLGGFVNQFLEVPNRQRMNKKENRHRGNSLRKFPWDEHEAVSESEQLISSTVKEWYEAKHRETSADEIKLINSIKIRSCPICGSDSFILAGHYGNGIQRYQCKRCNSRFNSLTNTIFQDKKIPISEWIEYLIHLFELNY